MKTIPNITYPAFALFGLACFALAPATDAQCPQICDGDLENTAVGDSALINNTGFSNTAIGFGALGFNTTGNDNTASGVGALGFTTTGSQNTAIDLEALFFTPLAASTRRSALKRFEGATESAATISQWALEPGNSSMGITISISATWALPLSQTLSASGRLEDKRVHLSPASVEQLFQPV